MILYLQFFGGRGAGSGIGNFLDWLNNEGVNPKGKANPIDISRYQGKSLEEIEKRIRRLGHEELFAINENGNIVAAYKGDSTSVAFPVELIREKNLTVTHGHPKGYEEFGGTFSFADINNMLNSNWNEHRATASGQGEMNYIMRKTERADPDALRNRINKDFERLNQKVSETYRQSYLQERKRCGQKQARHIARQQAVGILNAYYREVFPQHGYEYVTRKKEYRYNR